MLLAFVPSRAPRLSPDCPRSPGLYPALYGGLRTSPTLLLTGASSAACRLKLKPPRWVEWCGVSDTACLLPMAGASLPWADIGPITEMHVHIVSDDLVTHVIGTVEDGHGHLQRRFVFTVDDKSVTASAMTTRLFTRLLTHGRPAAARPL
jgi:hypothetical protein